MNVGSSDGPREVRKSIPARVESGELIATPAGGRLADPRRVDVDLSGVFIATSEPLPVGSVLSVNIRLAESAPALTGLARVERIETGGPGERSGMELTFLDVWGKQAIEQLSEYMDEASGGMATAARWTTGLRVLVVDDDPSYRERAAQAMRGAGFEVITAANGFEGLSAALKHQPTVILTDVTMPGMDGWQLLRMVRARPTLRRTPVLFLTDLQSDEQRTKGYALGVDDYLPKPFTDVELIARVERVIERAQLADEGGANGMRGDLSKMPISSLLAFAEMERRTAVVQLMRDGEKATLHLRDGAVVRIDLDSTYDDLEGIERFFHVLEWERGRFELTSTDVKCEDQLNLPTTFVLLEYARRKDEARGV